jgi:hypothetical protein
VESRAQHSLTTRVAAANCLGALFLLYAYGALGGYGLSHGGQGGWFVDVLDILSAAMFFTGTALFLSHFASDRAARHGTASFAAWVVWPIAVVAVLLMATLEYPGHALEALFGDRLF